MGASPLAEHPIQKNATRRKSPAQLRMGDLMSELFRERNLT